MPIEERSPAFWISSLGPPVALMGAIYWLGSDRGSAEQTSGLLAGLLRLLPGLGERLTPELVTTLNVCLRKGGHFAGYALLGVLNARAARALRGSLERPEAAGAWAAATTWAAVDEYHQSFSPSRGAAVEDVVLDGIGAAAGIFLYLRWLRRCPPSS